MDLAAKGKINPEDAPPMERAEVQHIQCLLTVVWQTLNAVCLDPLQWGWKQDAACFTPIQTDDVAPRKVMKFTRCN